MESVIKGTCTLKTIKRISGKNKQIFSVELTVKTGNYIGLFIGEVPKYIKHGELDFHTFNGKAKDLYNIYKSY